MNDSTRKGSFAEKSWKRDEFLSLLNTALNANENKYTRKAAVAWLSTYPSDLQVRLLHARSLLAEGNQALQIQSLKILEEICTYDPEFVEAQKALLKAQKELNLKAAETTANVVLALGGSTIRLPHSQSNPANWAIQLRDVRRNLAEKSQPKSAKTPGDLEQAEEIIHQVLVASPNTPIAAVTHLRVVMAAGNIPNAALNSIAKSYYERWPKCLPLILIYAHSAMAGAGASQAVSLLHQAVSMDICGQAANRLWGENHPYKSLWIEDLEIAPGLVNSPQNIPIPARVAAVYGWNRLPTVFGETNEEPMDTLDDIGSTITSTQEKTPVVTNGMADSIKSEGKPQTQAQYKSSNNANRDGRFPIYVVFSTQKGLEQKYNAQYATIYGALQRLVKAVRSRRIGHQNWGSLLFLADNSEVCNALGIKPAVPNDPWSLKLALRDLDDALAKRGERIGALIIIGGHDVVPFHHLPNPVEDIDREVPSDNPYGSRDENYFVLEWPVGRLPGGAENEALNLINLINNASEQHENASRSEPWYIRIWKIVRKVFQAKSKGSSANLGYTAAVWQRASLAVFRAIGEPRSLLISPPVQACEVNSSLNANTGGQTITSGFSDSKVSCLVLPSSQFGYFNLHGLAEASEWFGQRDPIDPNDGPDFPIALRPQDIRNSGSAPRLVFSEACYGAYIHNKKADEAISIKFLTSGTLGVVGSTSTCYGSISSPLIAADLLGKVYWGLVTEGNHAGEALRKAKLYMAREMHHRQGYLDGEDQKTLISFVLYGDPLAQPYPASSRRKLIKVAPELPGHLLTLSDQDIAGEKDLVPSQELTSHVKQVVKQYLPGMTDANIQYQRGILRHACDEQTSPNVCRVKHHIDLKDRQVVILSKRITQAKQLHTQVARLTMDKSGKLVKLVVSR